VKLRDAFDRAAAPRAKSLALEAFGDHGEAELSKVRTGARRPTFDAIERAFDADPEALADYCRERFGWRIERPAAPVAQQLELIFADVRSISERLDQIAKQQEQSERAGMARAVPAPTVGRRRA